MLQEFWDQVEASQVLSWVVAIVLIVVAILLGMWLQRLIRRASRKHNTMEAAGSVLSRVVQSVIVVVAVFLALDLVGLNIQPVLASAGVIGIVVGLAVKDIAENYIARIIMGFRRAFEIGDEIIVATEFVGRVEELSLRYTRLRTRDGLRIYLPNAFLLSEPLVNLTRNGSRRGEFLVGIALDSDLEHARTVAINAAKDVEGVIEPEPQAWITELAASSATLMVRYWYEPDGSNQGIRSAVILAVERALDEANIVIPSKYLAIEVSDSLPRGLVEDPGD